MGRLIDADKLLTQVRQIDFLKMPNSTKLCASEIMMMINRQPTAYNVDKVLEELDDAAYYYCWHCINAAIEIVRKGGVE